MVSKLVNLKDIINYGNDVYYSMTLICCKEEEKLIDSLCNGHCNSCEHCKCEMGFQRKMSLDCIYTNELLKSMNETVLSLSFRLKNMVNFNFDIKDIHNKLYKVFKIKHDAYKSPNFNYDDFLIYTQLYNKKHELECIYNDIIDDPVNMRLTSTYHILKEKLEIEVNELYNTLIKKYGSYLERNECNLC